MRRLYTGLVVAVLAAGGCVCGHGDPARIRVRIGSLEVHADLAMTPEQRAQGLSGRASLAENEGMVFVFSSAAQPTFWMKGMRFSLDFIWISADHRVVDLTERVPPPEPGTKDTELPVYRPTTPVRYTLEVNQGLIAASGIHVGDAVTFDPAPPVEGVR